MAPRVDVKRRRRTRRWRHSLDVRPLNGATEGSTNLRIVIVT